LRGSVARFGRLQARSTPDRIASANGLDVGRVMKRVGGRLLVGQSGGCTQVINASLIGVVEEAARRAGSVSVWGARHGVEGILNADLIDLGKESEGTLRRVARSMAAALGSCRRRIDDGEATEIVEFFARNDIRTFIYIGGNDSADTSHRIAAAAERAGYGLSAVAVPKTIDNDLSLTDHCPGFGSTARFIASVVADTGMETESMRTVEPVKIIEVMGRNAGWLAAASALAKRSERDAPHIVWPPEVPFESEKFIRQVKCWLDRIGYCVVVAAETIRDSRGRPVARRGKRREADEFGHPRTADAAAYLCELVSRRIGVRARWDKPGTIQRMSSAHVSPVDVREAKACGRWAVRFARRGRSDCMVIMRRQHGAKYAVTFDTAPLKKIANREQLLPAAYFNRRRMLPTPAFCRYAAPLVGPNLPSHPRLRGRAARVR